MQEPILKVSNLKVEFNRNVILDNISFEVRKNEVLSVIGPNGSGKTTLFRALLELIPYSGKIIWHSDIRIGYVPQRLAVDQDLPLTTAEFFALKKASKKEIDFVLKTVGFEEDKPHKGHLKDHILNEKLGVLSGGEFQRVIIAWALLGDSNVLLFDEPTTGIDISAEETIYSLLYKLQKQKDLTIILISHELHVVYKYATNVLCLNKKAVCFGPPKEALDENNLNKLFGSNVSIYEHHR